MTALQDRQHVADLPALDSLGVVRAVLVELAVRGIVPALGPVTLARAQEASARVLWALGLEDGADPMADQVVELEPYLRPEAVGRGH